MIKKTGKEMTKTIIYIGGFIMPDANAAATRVVNNAKIFQSLGYRVILVGVSNDRPNDGEVYPVRANDNNIESWEMGYPNNRKSWMFRAVADAPLRKILEKVNIDTLDMVICYNHPAISQYRIARLARMHGALAVTDCTEWYARHHWTSLFGIVKNIDVALRMHIINKMMDGMITTSPYISEYYRRLGKPIIEIPTLIEEPLIPEPPQINSKDSKIRLFFAGSGFDKKSLDNSTEGLKDRLDWLIPILYKTKQNGADFHMDLFGVSLEQYIEIIPQHKKMLKEMEENLTFHGRQPRKLLLKMLPAAAFSIFFRKKTRTNLAGFPSKFSESISYGTPVITNEMPSSIQYMIEGKTGYYIDPSDIDRASQRLIDIFNQPYSIINAQKLYCYKSKTFEYNSFIPIVKKWMDDFKRG